MVVKIEMSNDAAQLVLQLADALGERLGLNSLYNFLSEVKS